MAIYRALYRGNLGGVEVFEHGWWFETDNNDLVAVHLGACSQWLTDFLDTAVAPSAAAKTVFPGTTAWTSVRVQRYAGGEVDDAAEISNPRSGTSAAVGLPLEVAGVVTLRSAVAGERNRQYLPPVHINGLQTSPPGTWNETALVAPIVRSMVAAWSTFVTATRRVAVARNVGTPGLATRTAILAEMGSVPDAQRRRRNRQLEVRFALPVDLS